MFSYEERIKAVKLLIQYDKSYATVVRELGYPSKRALANWYEEYIKNGDLHKNFIKESKYSEEERRKAVDYYLEHGRCISRTVKALGYPSRPELDSWITEIAPEKKHHCHSGGSLVKYTHEQKEQAVISLCSRSKSAREVASEIGVTREILYKWKRQLLSKGYDRPMPRKRKTLNNSSDVECDANSTDLQAEKVRLEIEVNELQKEIYRLQLERDILETAAAVIKKDQGINLKTLSNREKAIVINALREKYQLKYLLKTLHMAKSSYCYQVLALSKTDKYNDLRNQIKETFDEAYSRYGYRRIHSVIKSTGIKVSEKVIRRIMKEEQLIVPNNQRKKYNSYKGEISPEVENVIQRDFYSDKPNARWLTDITEFHIPAGKIYLSPIIDCFDGLPVSWAIGTSPDAELVNTMLDEAIFGLRKDEHPIIHSDRGCHYRWPGWIERMEKAKLTRSMSKKGCSPDNSACEGFFGRLKNEMFYGFSWAGVSITQFIEQLDKYIKWYGEKRIKLSLGGKSPLDYRRSLELVV